MPERLVVAFRFLLAVTVIAITVLSLSPSAPSAPGGNDKLSHLLAYAVIAFLLVLSVRRSPNRFLHVLTVLGVTIVYGIVIEVVQKFTGREFDIADMAANSLGAVVGTVAGLATRRLIGDRSETADR